MTLTNPALDFYLALWKKMMQNGGDFVSFKNGLQNDKSTVKLSQAVTGTSALEFIATLGLKF